MKWVIGVGFTLCATALGGCGWVKSDAQTAPEPVSAESVSETSSAINNARKDPLTEQISLILDYQSKTSEQIQQLNQQVQALAVTVDQLQQVKAETGHVLSASDAPVLTPVIEAGDKVVLGRVEYVWLEALKRHLKARVDTGARSSSLHAKNIQAFERNGKKWVSFDVVLDDGDFPLEAPLERYVRIRQASSDQLESRPVVTLNVELGNISEETTFTLSDREDMLYPVLLGRNFLRDIALVDVAKKFTQERRIISSNLPSKEAVQ